MANESNEPSYTLYVYHTRYSSWGARVQLILQYFQIAHKLEYFYYNNPALSPPVDLGTSTLPVLDVPGSIIGTGESESETEPLRVADSLAISEFLAEQHPAKPLWPRDPYLRALARTAAAKMHSGFTALRGAYACNFVTRYTGPGIPLDDATAKDVRDIVELWSGLRAATTKRLALLGKESEDEGFLCGGFSIADAFFWPVLWRFRTYNVPLTGISEDGLKWMETMWNDPVTKALGREYFQQARDPQTHNAMYEDIFKGIPGVKSEKFAEDWVFERTST
ncbi:hypothetical protein HD806DRAFT_315620 [Xylariaceae sp. AK1471]|nr:hypothetical protein HD806DRAFT_315620 [Xylariaceae sp. AK1471]